MKNIFCFSFEHLVSRKLRRLGKYVYKFFFFSLKLARELSRKTYYLTFKRLRSEIFNSIIGCSFIRAIDRFSPTIYHRTSSANALIKRESFEAKSHIFDNARFQQELQLLYGVNLMFSLIYCSVLMDGVKYYANEPTLLGKAFLRLERYFDNHVNYCRDEHMAQEFLDTSDAAFDYFAVSVSIIKVIF